MVRDNKGSIQFHVTPIGSIVDIICHSGCDDMADVARYYLEESGQLGELPAHLQNYIDYAAYGRDMELEGTFVVTNHGVYEIIR